MVDTFHATVSSLQALPSSPRRSEKHPKLMATYSRLVTWPSLRVFSDFVGIFHCFLNPDWHFILIIISFDYFLPLKPLSQFLFCWSFLPPIHFPLFSFSFLGDRDCKCILKLYPFMFLRKTSSWNYGKMGKSVPRSWGTSWLILTILSEQWLSKPFWSSSLLKDYFFLPKSLNGLVVPLKYCYLGKRWNEMLICKYSYPSHKDLSPSLVSYIPAAPHQTSLLSHLKLLKEWSTPAFSTLHLSSHALLASVLVTPWKWVSQRALSDLLVIMPMAHLHL